MKTHQITALWRIAPVDPSLGYKAAQRSLQMTTVLTEARREREMQQAIYKGLRSNMIDLAQVIGKPSEGFSLPRDAIRFELVAIFGDANSKALFDYSDDPIILE